VVVGTETIVVGTGVVAVGTGAVVVGAGRVMVGTGKRVGNGAVLSRPIVAQPASKTEIIKNVTSLFITVVILSAKVFFLKYTMEEFVCQSCIPHTLSEKKFDFLKNNA
jgi:hypothetical protein